TPGDESASTTSSATDMREPDAWVTSVCRYPDARFAASEVSESSVRVRDALRAWRPPLGRANWKCRNGLSGDPRRDESIPATTYTSVEQCTALHQAWTDPPRPRAERRIHHARIHPSQGHRRRRGHRARRLRERLRVEAAQQARSGPLWPPAAPQATRQPVA